MNTPVTGSPAPEEAPETPVRQVFPTHMMQNPVTEVVHRPIARPDWNLVGTGGLVSARDYWKAKFAALPKDNKHA